MEVKDYKIATIGSHSALQILKGAKDEGFGTICICTEERRSFYESFGVADEVITVKKYKDFFYLENYLIEQNAIVVPHGSFVQYLGPQNVKKLKVMHYGTKEILEWESDRNKERKWLNMANIKTPKIFADPKDINKTVIVKFHGAGGGRDYFLANSPDDFEKQIRQYPGREYAIQEYIVGVPIYPHFFYSRLKDELEIMSFDERYESNANSIGRISALDQLKADIKTSYTIVGNVPIVVRESLLPKILKWVRGSWKSQMKLLMAGFLVRFAWK